MKIAILGPDNTDKCFGGVGTFDSGLNDEFISKGHDSKIFSRCYNKGKQKLSKINFFLSFIKAPKNILDFKPELVIASLEYTLLIMILKKKLPNTKFITVLHGFPTYRYSFRKRYLLLNILRRARKHSHLVVSNSKLTALMNNEIYGIKTDLIIYLGLKEKYIDYNKIKSDEIVFLYVGRLVQEKNVDLVCQLYLILEPFYKNSRLDIVGDGPEYDKLSQKFKRNNIIFHGKKSREDTLDFYKRSKVFISLNPHEPFGLVYLEALINKCKIICPDTGGQTEYLMNNKNSYFINIYDMKNSLESLNNFITQDYDEDLEDFFQYYSFDRIATDYVRAYKKISEGENV